ncbi:adenosine deaminase [Haloprofundus marisrubri]|uniref:Adenosine deaminase n=1 Tax=Haloprofundus marisrubri TaxID=1514971 RepID=A0A0W1R604_9EURY|nr:DUF655 domain-containing protein [Haloprofundus marisrubri]KTG08652.1 adenosine deaminase [Haloprofundus marisrubri]
MSGSERGDDEAESQPQYAVVLDYLPYGRSDDDRPRYQKQPIAYALGEERFRLVELTFDDEADVGIGDRVAIEPNSAREHIQRIRDVEYDDLSNSAVNELEYVVADIIDADEERFVSFYSDAQPITIRLHQLDLLPGIGKTLRNNILEQRKRQPFESFEDLHDRVSGLHRPKEVLAERIIEELRDDDLKYKAFVRRD